MANEPHKAVIVSANGGDPEVATYAPPYDHIGYVVDDPKYPGCLRMWFGRKTVIVPLRNLLRAEFDT